MEQLTDLPAKSNHVQTRSAPPGNCRKHVRSNVNSPFSERKILPDDFSLSSKDIISGHGKLAYYHAGKVHFHIIVAMNLKLYIKAKTREEKSIIVRMIVDNTRESNPVTGGFVKKNSLFWEMDNSQ
jgi:hypothetical protein